MDALRLHAIGVNEVRDMFGASPELAARLRRIATETFRVASEPAPAPGLLGMLGPLLRTAPDAPLVPHGTPLPSDVDALIASRFVAPQRLGEAWRLVHAWLAACSHEHLELELDTDELRRLDFALGAAGLPSHHGLASLMALDAQLPLRPAPGLRVGHCKHAHAVASGHALTAVLDEVAPRTRERLTPVADFLTSFETLAGAARRDGRALPDLVVTSQRS